MEGKLQTFFTVFHHVRVTEYIYDQIYLAGVIYFGANCALASISAFLPTIIKTFGFSKFIISKTF